MYTVQVSTDAYGDVFESTQIGNNIMTKEFEIKQVLPDLTIDNYNTIIMVNQRSSRIDIQMNVSIKNIGDMDVTGETWYNFIVFSFPSGEEVNVGKVQENLVIQKEQAYNYTYYLQIQRRPILTVDVSFVVDFYNNFIEKDKLNNKRTKSHRLPQLYDMLEISSFKLFDSTLNYEIREVYSGQEIVVSIVFVNQKNYATLSGWSDHVYLECNAYFNLLKQTYIEQLKGNETFNALVKIIIPENIFGQCYINYKHDINRDLVRNDTQSLTFKAPIYAEIPPTSDLHPEEINFKVTQNGILVSWTVKNIGNQMLRKLMWKDQIIMSRIHKWLSEVFG